MFDSNNSSAPKIVCDVADCSVPAVIATAKKAISAGADVIHINVSRIDYTCVDELAPIFSRINVPILASNRRSAFFHVYGEGSFTPRQESDEQRTNILLDCVSMGCSGIDIEFDTFHDHPLNKSIDDEAAAGLGSRDLGPVGDVSFSDDVCERQKEFIAKIQAAGARVILSSHTSRPVSAEEACILERAAAERGADFFKLIVRTKKAEDDDEIIRAALQLRRSSSIPYIIYPLGDRSLATRAALFLLGGAWVLGQENYVPTGFDQQPLVDLLPPLVRILKAR